MKKEDKTELLNRKSRKIAVREGASYSLMDGFGLRYITPYALALGASNFHIGLLSSIPSLFGNLSQLFTLKAMEKYSRKKIVFWGVFLQAIMWLVLIAAGSLYFTFKIDGRFAPQLLILIYTMLILFGAFSGPAWSSWMRDVVTKDRGKYFGNRNKVVGTVAIISMLIAGFILDYFKETNIFLGFSILFFIAFIGRFYSSFLMLKIHEPPFKSEKDKYFSIFQFIQKMRYNNFGRFVLYFSLVSFAVAIASPFFAVYLLKNLEFTYTKYMIIILSASIASILSMPFWGKLADKYGTVQVMKLCGTFIPLVPFLWILSAFLTSPFDNIIIYLIIIEIISGAIWAGFNLAASNFIFDAVSRERMAICVSYFSIISGIGILIGALIGGLISNYNFSLFGLNSILFIFLISGIIRMIVYLYMNSKIQEVRDVRNLTRAEARKITKQGIRKTSHELNSLIKSFYNFNIMPFKPRPTH